jgi:hypothetical protein
VDGGPTDRPAEAGGREAEPCGQCLAEAGDEGVGDDEVDVGRGQPVVGEELVGHLARPGPGGAGEVGGLGDRQPVAPADGAEGGAEAVAGTAFGRAGEPEPQEPVLAGTPAARDGRPGCREREPGRQATPGGGVAGDDEGVADGACAQEAVHDLEPGEHAARPVGHVERERAVATGVGVLGVGADVFLDQGRESGFAEVAVVVETGVDEQVDARGRQPGAVEGAAGGRVGERVGGTPAPVTAGHDGHRLNHCCHGTPPVPRRR